MTRRDGWVLALAAAAGIALWAWLAAAQGQPEAQAPLPVTAWPVRGIAAGGNASSTITLGGAYQQVFAQSLLRKACTIQNNGAHTMYVFPGALASATHATSVQIGVGGIFYCNSGNLVITDQISIDGTTSDAFYAGQQ